jgi:hypothetical protein
MAISKKSNSNGSAGGNGMQTYSIDYLQDCEVYHEYKGGHVVPCSHCGEDYILDPGHTFHESVKLSIVLEADGCPYCNQKEPLTEKHLEWFMENKNKVLQFEFEIEGSKLVKVYRKPLGWKAITKKQLREAFEDKEAA